MNLKFHFVIAGVLLAMASCKNMKSGGSGDISLATESDSVSYAIGHSVGQSLMQQELKEVNPEIIAKAIADVLGEQQLVLDEMQCQMALQKYMMKKQQEFMEKQQKVAEENAEKEKAFFAENAKKEGVKSTESGLQYEVIQEGKGASPKLTDIVKVHYTGTLTDGKVFDSSVERGQPAEFTLGQVIPGWQEGLQLMKAGAKYKLYIPSELGYGPQGAGQDIGPNATLIFEVELLEVKPGTE